MRRRALRVLLLVVTCGVVAWLGVEFYRLVSVREDIGSTARPEQMHAAVRSLRPIGEVRWVTNKTIRADVYFASGTTTLDDVKRFAIDHRLSFLAAGGRPAKIFGGPSSGWPAGHIVNDYSEDDASVMGYDRAYGMIDLHFRYADGAFTMRVLRSLGPP